MEVTNYEGETRFISITATASRVVEGNFNIGIIDSKGITTGTVDLMSTSQMSYVAKMQLAPSLAVGTHEGSLEVRVCRDSPLTCAQPISGSPWQVPYKVSIRSATNLTPLVPLPGALEWSTSRGNSARTAVVDADVSAANFNRRWALRSGLSGALSHSGRLFGWNNSGIAAYAEHDGSKIWGRGDGGSSERDWHSGLTVSNGRLWVIAEDYDWTISQLGSNLLAYDSKLGTLLSTTRLEPSPQKIDFEIPRVPSAVIDQGAVFSGTISGTVRRHAEADGKLSWSAMPSSEPLSPMQRGLPVSVAHGRLVGFDGRRLIAMDPATGATLFSIKAEGGTANYQGAAPVLASADRAYVTSYFSHTAPNPVSAGGRLTAFDLSTRTQRWTRGEMISSSAVEKDRTVYVVDSGNSLLALDSATGAEQWRWGPAQARDAFPGKEYPLLIVGKYVFISMGDATYAVDSVSRKTAWEYPMGGSLAVTANGTLVISGIHGVVAVNLR
ncbi:outer membrane protein assembly factor BamB [Inhella inkyongensis]|uniref:Outer membrane protein assembly factor BamB n=1 Tax=Inhella inkyongensis TaxID=392593 RepID=A0A840S4E1_9BURK|nr:outer membrane protein assembly factor BamB [Inhella inkyongensis]